MNLEADLVFIVWSIPGFNGIQIEAVYRDELDAIKCVDEHNAAADCYDQWSYMSEPLL